MFFNTAKKRVWGWVVGVFSRFSIESIGLGGSVVARSGTYMGLNATF
jgi:hypothetical protein